MFKTIIRNTGVFALILSPSIMANADQNLLPVNLDKFAPVADETKCVSRIYDHNEKLVGVADDGLHLNVSFSPGEMTKTYNFNYGVTVKPAIYFGRANELSYELHLNPIDGSKNKNRYHLKSFVSINDEALKLLSSQIVVAQETCQYGSIGTIAYKQSLISKAISAINSFK